ncbi:hypothetical protein BGX34_004468 [Mortierella sp. NVP85]|nr:hypothetical protein BGX34_004468 [Mortierella sp. NVP85]
MSSRVSIFDIPLIMERIGFYLNQRDRSSCALVNKTFYEHFLPLVWQNLVFTRPTPIEEVELTLGHKQAILNYGRYIRRMEIDTECCKSISTLLSLSCHRLKELTLFINQDPEDASLSPMIQLMINNSWLRTLSLGSYASLTCKTLQQLSVAFLTSHHMTELTLGFAFRPHSRWFRYMLQNLPPLLKKLYLQWGESREYDNTFDFSTISNNWPETYSQLEEVELEIEIDDLERPVFLQFLNRCTTLKDLAIPAMDSAQTLHEFIRLLEERSLPMLRTLDIRSLEDIDPSQWDRLCVAMNGRIQDFRTGLRFNSSITQHYIQQLATYWSETLTNLRIDEPSRISSQDIQLILTRCSKLKSFQCLCPWVVMAFQQDVGGWDVAPGLGAMIRDDDQDGQRDMPNWVCLDLEELRLTFADERRVYSDTSLSASQERWTRRGIERVYYQLGRLTKLKELAIGWNSGKAFSTGVNLDMSLESGLGHLEGLSVLKMIDFNFVPMIKVGLEEVIWMARYWSKLKNIKGLRYRLDLGCRDQQEPDYICWLRTNRPNIIIQ